MAAAVEAAAEAAAVAEHSQSFLAHEIVHTKSSAQRRSDLIYIYIYIHTYIHTYILFDLRILRVLVQKMKSRERREKDPKHASKVIMIVIKTIPHKTIETMSRSASPLHAFKPSYSIKSGRITDVKKLQMIIKSELHYMTKDGGRREKLQKVLLEELESEKGLTKRTQIALTKEILKNRFGSKCADMLADEFVYDACYERPRTKQEFLSLVEQMNLQGGFPNSEYELLDDSMRVEWDSKVRNQTYKVWCTTQFRGRHSGKGMRIGKGLFSKTIPATGIHVLSAPEVSSFTYDGKTGKCTRISAGYMADHAIGNTKNRGGYHGIYLAIGHPLPKPHSYHKMFTDAFPDFLGFSRQDMVWVMNIAFMALAVSGGNLGTVAKFLSGSSAEYTTANVKKNMKKKSIETSLVQEKLDTTTSDITSKHELAP